MSAMKLAEYLKKKISESNLNQREISDKARITRQTLHRLQSGEVHEMKLSTKYLCRSYQGFSYVAEC